MRDFFKYPRRSFEAHTSALSMGIAIYDSGIFRESGLFVVVLTDPRMTMWIYFLVGYGVAPEKIVVLTPDAELGAEFFMGSGSFPALRVIIGDPLESVMEFHQKALVLVFGDTRDGVLRDISTIRRFADITLKHNGLLILDYPSTFLYVTPSEGQESLDEDPYERFTQLVREYDPHKPSGVNNAYETLQVAAGTENLKVLYDQLDQVSPRLGFVATNLLMGFDIRPNGLLMPASLTTLSARRISKTKSLKSFHRLRDAVRRQAFPVQVIHLRPDPLRGMPPLSEAKGALQIFRMQIGLHPDERQFDSYLPPSLLHK